MLGTSLDLGKTDCLGEELQTVGFVCLLRNKASFSFVAILTTFLFLSFDMYAVFIFTALPLPYSAVIFVVPLSFTICSLIFAVMSFVALMLPSPRVSFCRPVRG